MLRMVFLLYGKAFFSTGRLRHVSAHRQIPLHAAYKFINVPFAIGVNLR